MVLSSSTCIESKIAIKNAAIYWNFKNVITNYNDTLGTITFDEGYWTFDMIKTKLKESNIKLERNAHNNTYKIFSENQN